MRQARQATIQAQKVVWTVAKVVTKMSEARQLASGAYQACINHKWAKVYATRASPASSRKRMVEMTASRVQSGKCHGMDRHHAYCAAPAKFRTTTSLSVNPVNKGAFVQIVNYQFLNVINVSQGTMQMLRAAPFAKYVQVDGSQALMRVLTARVAQKVSLPANKGLPNAITSAQRLVKLSMNNGQDV